MGKTKRKLEGLLVVRHCWTLSEAEALARTKEDCVRDGCPYANTDECEMQATIDAIELAEDLWKKVKKLRREIEHDSKLHGS